MAPARQAAPARVDAPASLPARPDVAAELAEWAEGNIEDLHQIPVPLPVPARTAMVARPTVAPIPTEEFLRTVRDAQKERIAKGATANPALVGLGPTRTPGTVEAYRNRGKQLLNRFKREQRQPIDSLGFVPREYAYWLLSLRPGLKAPTWRIYRQASLMLLGSFPNEEAQAAIELIENDAPGERAMETGDAIPAGALPTERMTSARKRKYFKYDEWQRIEAYIRLKNRSDTAYILIDWLRAGLATGLRPAEWKATNLQRITVDGEERTFLFVLNAKATNGRGNGAVRTLDLTALSAGTISVIERMSNLGIAAFSEGRFDQLQSNCSQILYQACNKLWSRRENHYALYSCRHQFMANMKALGLPNEEVSAMAGHVVDETAAQAYGRKSVGWSEDKIVDRPRGVKDEIATVRRRLVLWEERQALVTVSKHGPGDVALPPMPEPATIPAQFEPMHGPEI